MSAEIDALRRELERLHGRAETKLFRRYGRLPSLERPSLYRRLRTVAGGVLRWLGLRPTPPLEPWIPALRHAASTDEDSPLVIWALGVDRDTLRAACRGLKTLHGSMPELAPVLVTDVADFAFFSRLGWLVEYVPTIGAGRYAERKRRYLAWRYRDAQVLPASVGLGECIRREDLLID